MTNNFNEQLIQDNSFLDISKLIEAIKIVTDEKGFCLSSSMPKLIRENCNVDYKTISKSIAEFVKSFLSTEFTLLKEIIVDDKKIPNVIVPNDKVNDFLSVDLLIEAIRNITDKVGYCLASSMPDLISENCNIDYKTISKSIAEFVKSFLSTEFTLLKEIIVDDKKIPNVIVPNDNVSSFQDVAIYTVKNSETLSDKSVELIENRIQEVIDINGVFLCSLFPSFIREFGIEDYHVYAKSIEEFVNKYLSSKFTFKKKLQMGGKNYPNVIISKSIESKNDTLEDTNQNIYDFRTLESLFASNDWYGYLSSPVFNQADTSSLPIQYIEKGVECANKIINGDNSSEIELTLFEKELITCTNTKEFFHKWKKKAVYKEEILKAYAKSSMCDVSVENNKYLLVRIINDIGQDYKPNTTFKSLTSRFEYCKDRIVSYLYVIRLFGCRSNNAIEQSISDYCYFIKNLNIFNVQEVQKKVFFEKEVLNFISFIKLAVQRYGEQTLPRSVITNIISVFFDIKQIKFLEEILTIIDEDKKLPEWELLCYLESNKWTQEQTNQLISKVNLQLVEKGIANIWDRYSNQKMLEKEFLLVLSWIANYCHKSVLDEIILIHYSSNYTKKQKQIALIESLIYLFEQKNELDNNYKLISYVIKYVLPDFSKSEEFNFDKICNEWECISKKFFDMRLGQCLPLSKDNEPEFVALFNIFEIDEEKEKQLQELYGEWFIKQYDWLNSSQDEILEKLNITYKKRGYRAIQLVCEKVLSECTNAKFWCEVYIYSLINLKAFGRVIQFVYECEHLNQKEREEYIVKTLCENFVTFGFSEKSTFLFNESFTINEAIEILNAHFSVQDYPLILSLIILYSFNGELVKSVYLFYVFQSRVKIGYSRIIAQFYSIYGRHLKKIKNHYDVIQTAFNSLSASTLLEFVRWAGKIKIPDYSDYNPSHVFSAFYDSILIDVENVNAWKKMFTHITDNDVKKQKNAWMICVCGITMMCNFNAPSNSIIKDSFMFVMEHCSDELPINLLSLLCQYIIKTGDFGLSNQLYKILCDRNIKEQLLETNPWCKNDGESIDAFVEYCFDMLQETGSTLYSEIIANIKEEITSDELVELSHFSKNKNFLIKKICQCYFRNSGMDEVGELLNPELWQKTSYQEKEIYNVFKLVYETDLYFLVNYSKYFSDEKDVQRFKQDCIKIISSYPDSNAFMTFDKECLDVKHKLLVYSFVLGIFYNEDIYHYYWFKYESLIEQDVYDVYIHYLEKCYEAQLIYNPSYIFEYKTWRYLKLLMINSIESERIDDTNIINLMKMNGHYERLISEGYNEFKVNIENLLSVNEINNENKRQLVFGLITDDFSSFWDLKDSFLYKLSLNSVNILKQIVSALNYRDVNELFYQKFIPLIGQVDNSDIVSLASTFSDSLSLAFSEWFNLEIKETNSQLFKEIAITTNTYGKSKGNITVEKVLCLDENLYIDNKTFFNAVMLSKQLPGKIFDRLRMSAIGSAKGRFNERFHDLAIYLKNNGFSMAISQYQYLIAIWYATEKKHEKLKDFLNEVGTTFLDEVPADWRADSVNILAYAKDDGKFDFKPNNSFYYSESYLVKTEDISFINLVYQNYKCYRNKTDYQTSKPKIKDITNGSIDINQRISKVLNYFHTVGVNGENIGEAIELGFLLISKESIKITANHKLAILIDLLNQLSYLSQVQKERIFECFDEIYRELSIDEWVENVKGISNILSLNAQDSDVSEVVMLLNNILEKCPEFNEPSKSRATEILYSQLKNIAFIGSSIYVSAIKAAAIRRMKQIEVSARITVYIENVDKELHDGCVYLQLKNNGYVTLDLHENCEILLTAILPDKKVSKYNVSVDNIHKLRAGWITGCVQPIDDLCKECNMGDFVEIRIEVRSNNKLITRTTSSLKICQPVLLSMRPRAGYRVDFAAGENNKNRLYGRKEEQEEITYAIELGKAVIYGPSRIGKTSLLNWVRHDLASKRGNVITVLFGGEGGKGKESDYIKYFYDSSHKEIEYENENRSEINSTLSEYLLIDTLKYGLTDKRFARANFDAEIMKNEELIKQISNILHQNESIEYRYRQIDSVLKSYNSELWILFDEFQQVVENWSDINDNEPIEFIRLCESVNEINISNIKLIFCGSDELLRQMVLVRENSVWRKKILNTAGKVRIGPIKEPSLSDVDPFKEMICDDDSVVIPGIKYSDEALTAVCVYSARVPLYAKEICNAVLENISNTGVEKFGRNVIYSYDIAHATQKLAQQMLDDIIKNDITPERRNEFNTSRIVQIFDAVTKGLKNETDKQYLWFIANWFLDNPTKDKFPFSEFEETSSKRLVYGEDALLDSLTIAKERGILIGDKQNGYFFSTVFYHNAFCGTVNNLDEKKIFVRNNEERSSQDDEQQLDKFDTYVGQMSLAEKKDKHFDLYRLIYKEDKEYPDELRNLISGATQKYEIGGDYVRGDKKMQMNLQISAQTIQSFSTLLNGTCSASEFAKAFSKIPTIETYLGDEHEKVLALQEEINSYVDEEGEIRCESLEEYEQRTKLVEKNYEEIEQIVNRASERRGKDIASVVTIEDFVGTDDSVWEELLKVNFQTVKKLKELPTRYSSALSFAVIIHNVFDKIYKSSEQNKDVNANDLDFCPVAILYCKIVESMLKEEHTDIYSLCFPNRPIDSRKSDSPLFEKVNKNNPALTIGTYLHFLSTIRINQINKQEAYSKLNQFKFINDAEITTLANHSGKPKSEWVKHAHQLPVVASTRNKSAHEIKPIKKDRFDWLIDVLFEQGELMRIWDLVQSN